MLHLDIDRCHFRSEIVLLGLAILFGSVVSGCNQSSTSDFAKNQQAQEDAIAALTNLGAKITRINKDGMNGWSVDLSQIPFSSQIGDQLKILKSSIRVLDLSRTSIFDSQLAGLIDQMAITSVVELDLSYNPAITDQSLEKLERLDSLRDLNLTGDQVTEEGIARLQEKRKPIQFKADGPGKDSTSKMFNRSVPEYLKRDFKIRH